jgi:GntR family transcriptional regulator
VNILTYQQSKCVSVDVLPDPSSSIPLYAQVERLVRQMIELPPYRSGELLPDEVTLSRNWKVSRNTVRTAMSALVAEGVLQRQSGVGTRVRADRLSSGVAAWHSFTREMAKRGIAVQRLSRETACEVPPSEVAEALGTPSGSKVLRVDQVRGWDDIPSAAFQSYLHPRLGLRASDDFTRPLYDLIAERSARWPPRTGWLINSRFPSDRRSCCGSGSSWTPPKSRWKLPACGTAATGSP